MKETDQYIGKGFFGYEQSLLSKYGFGKDPIDTIMKHESKKHNTVESYNTIKIEDSTKIEQIILNKLGTFIATQRKHQKITQKKLNELSHVSLAVIADLENAKSMPRVETLIRLAIALGINLDEIFETMKCGFRDLSSNTAKSELSQFAHLSSLIAGFGYNKDEVEKIMLFILFIKAIRDYK